MCGVVRAGVDATGLRMFGAKIAGGRLFLNDGLFLSGMLVVSILVWRLRREGMHVDVSVRAIFRAEAAADAPILDNDFQRISAANRADGTTHHA